MHQNESIKVEGYGASFDLEADEPVKPVNVSAMLYMLVSEIAINCMAEGARSIGHIKCYLGSPHGFLAADTIGIKYGVSVKGNISRPITGGELVVNAIIVGLSKGSIEKITLDVINKASGENGFIVKEKSVDHDHNGHACDHE